MPAIIASMFTGVCLLLAAYMLELPGVILIMTASSACAFVTHINVPDKIKAFFWGIGIALAVLAFIRLVYQIL